MILLLDECQLQLDRIRILCQYWTILRYKELMIVLLRLGG